MVRTLLQSGQNLSWAAKGTDGSATSVLIVRIIAPAIVLAFLVALMMAALQHANQQQHSQTGITTQQPTTVSQQPAPNQSDVQAASDSVSAGPDTGDTNTSTTLKTESVVKDGQARVKVQINGQEVPIKPEGTTQRTITQDGAQTNVNVTIQNGQSSTGDVSGYNSSSSFSSSSQSLTITSN